MIWAKVKNIIDLKTLAKTKAKFNPVLHTSSYTIYCGYELDDPDQIVEDVVIAYSQQISPYLNYLEGTNVITDFYPNNNYRIYYFLYINDGTSNQLTQLVYSYEVSTIQKEIHPLVNFYIQDETSFLIIFSFDEKN